MNLFYVRYLLIFVLLSPLLLNAKTLYIGVIDRDNPTSLMKFFNKKKMFKKKDRVLFVDSKTAQLFYDKEFGYEDILSYSKKGEFVKRITKVLNIFDKRYNKSVNSFVNKKIFSKEANDFSRQLLVVHDLLTVYNAQYKNIKVIFFGNNYMHDAYGHNFKKGIPSDGFIYLPSSEFNSFDDIDVRNAKFAIFYDDEPYYKKDFFRFFKKLFKKKFNTELKSFNDNSTFNSDGNIEIDMKPFIENEVAIIEKAPKDECAELDQAFKNYIAETATIEIEIFNSCRKNSVVTFYHNGKIISVNADENGRAKLSVKAVIGKNTIEYNNLKGLKQSLYTLDISSSKSDIVFEKDLATATVFIKGNNPLRKNGSQVEIYNENTGNTYYLTVKNGKFEKSVPISIGKNKFIWKDTDGKEHERVINFEPKCVDHIELDHNYAEKYGIAKINLSNSCREDGSFVTFFYKTKEYHAFVDNGRADIDIILKSDVNDIFYENFDREKRKLTTIRIKDFEDLIRFIISYKDNVVVFMNIFEPNIKLDFKNPIIGIDYTKTEDYKDGHVHPQNINGIIGNMIQYDFTYINDYLSDKFIRTYTQIYVTHKSRIKNGDLYFYVDYASRHVRYEKELPLCGKRSLGGVVVDYEILSNGSIETGKKFLNPAMCKKSIEDGTLKPSQEDNNLIFIKKVGI